MGGRAGIDRGDARTQRPYCPDCPRTREPGEPEQRKLLARISWPVPGAAEWTHCALHALEHREHRVVDRRALGHAAADRALRRRTARGPLAAAVRATAARQALPRFYSRLSTFSLLFLFLLFIILFFYYSRCVFHSYSGHMFDIY